MIEQIFDAILPSIEHFRLIGYWVAFFAAFLETTLVIGLLLPGSSLLLLLGALSATGRLDVGDLLFFAIAGAILGDNLNYWLGQRYGQPLHLIYLPYRGFLLLRAKKHRQLATLSPPGAS